MKTNKSVDSTAYSLLGSKIAVVVLLTSGIILPEVLGYLTNDYSSSANYLSELGAIDAPFSQVIRYFGFLPVGIAIGYFGAFFFPCDSGCPATGTFRQSLHNMAGLIEYIGGVGGLFLLYFGLRPNMSGLLSLSTLIAACVVTFAVVLMFNPELDHLRGTTQRLADYTIFVWLCFGVLFSATLSNTHNSTRC